MGGRRCLHFDFGVHLRRAAEGACRALNAAERALARTVVAEGRLLRDEDAAIAAKVVRCFLAQHQVTPDDWIVLNGLPRHVGQTRWIKDILTVRRVAVLRCTPETVLERIRTDAGGDRGTRADDDLESVRKRLALYEEHTTPLVEHYRRGGAAVHEVPVGPTTTAGEMRRLLERAIAPPSFPP
jgi:adenylate kinase family enzyme